MSTELIKLDLFSTTKKDRIEIANNLISDLKEGNQNVLDLHLRLKLISDVIDNVTNNKDYKDLMLDEVKQKNQTYQNGTFDVMEAGIKYDFSNCGDEEILSMYALLSDIKKDITEREKFLKSLPAEGINYITKQGEAVTLYPPTKTSTTTIKTTLK